MTGLYCPKCQTHNGRLTDPSNLEKSVLIYACERCGHLLTRENRATGDFDSASDE
jgi:hypothetical protein